MGSLGIIRSDKHERILTGHGEGDWGFNDVVVATAAAVVVAGAAVVAGASVVVAGTEVAGTVDEVAVAVGWKKQLQIVSSVPPLH